MTLTITQENTNMSWSRSISGSPSEVTAAASNWAEEQKSNDSGLAPEAAEGHQQQIGAAAKAVGEFAAILPENALLSGSAWGHHNGPPESSQGGISLSYSVPAPVAGTAEPSTEPQTTQA